ncbi:MAG: hypothetical protein GC162_10385 [Planctomycetes bacterium]|nr:hypothetical protein [Planctomycetota bacterium]
MKLTGIGEINWTTVSRGDPAGFEIWQTDDGLTDLFLKITYGSSGGGSGTPKITAQLATATDGAGSLSGTQIGAVFTFLSPSTGSTVRTSYLSGDEGRLTMALFTGGSGCMLIDIERLRDATGDPVSDGVGTYGAAESAASKSYFAHQYLPTSGTPILGKTNTTGTILTPWPMVIPPLQSAGVTSAMNGSNWGMFPIFPWWGIVINPIVSLVGYFHADTPEYSTFSLSMYGTSRTYLALGTTNVSINSAPGFTLAMLWE